MHMLPLSQWHLMVYNQEKKIKIQTIKLKISTVQNKNKNKYHVWEPGDNNAFLTSIILVNALENIWLLLCQRALQDAQRQYTHTPPIQAKAVIGCPFQVLAKVSVESEHTWRITTNSF